MGHLLDQIEHDCVLAAIKLHVLLLQLLSQHQHTLLRAHVPENDFVGETAGKSSVNREEVIHLIIVSGEYDDDFRLKARLGQDTNHLVDSFFGKGPFAESIRFIDEQDSTQCLFEELHRLRSRLTDVLPNQVRRGALLDFEGRQKTHVEVDLSHFACYGCLSRPGWPFENPVCGDKIAHIFPVGFGIIGQCLILPEFLDDIVAANNVRKQFGEVRRRMNAAVEIGIKVLGFEDHIESCFRMWAGLVAFLGQRKKILHLARISKVGAYASSREVFYCDVFGGICGVKMLGFELELENLAEFWVGEVLKPEGGLNVESPGKTGVNIL